MRLIGIFVFLVLAFNVVADQSNSYESSIKQLNSFLQNGEYQQAFEFASAQTDYLGEPKFDFLLGIASLKSSNVHEAVFAFERVVSYSPNWNDARLYLAQSYYLANNDKAAKQQLNILSQKTLSDRQTKQSLKLIELVDDRISSSKSKLAQSLSVTFGQDSNINAGTTEDSIFIPSLNADVPLTSASQETSGHYVQLGYSGRYQYKVSQKQSYLFNWGIADYQFGDLSQYNRTAFYGSGDARYKIGENTYIASLSIMPLWLDGDFYRMQTMAKAGLEHPISDTFTLLGSWSVGEINNNVANTLDMQVNTLSVGGRALFKNMLHSVNLSITSENAKIGAGNYNAKDSTQLMYRLGVMLGENQQYALSVGLAKQRYGDLHPLFLVKRDETLYSVSNSYQYKLDGGLAFRGALVYQDKTSNLDLYEYDRFDVSVAVVYQF